MDEFSTTSFTLDQTDEDILIYTVSDEVLEERRAWRSLTLLPRGFALRLLLQFVAADR